MIVYRITKKEYAQDLSGRGAEKYGGRWNDKGVPILYTSSTRSLAMLEVLVHIPVGYIPSDLAIVSIQIPKTRFKKISAADLPLNWRTPAGLINTRAIGNQFVRENKQLVLTVPSVLMMDESNVLINTGHPDYGSVIINDIESMSIDERLLKKS